MQKVIIGTNQDGQRLDKFLHKYLPQAGSGFLYKMLRKKNITLNGKKAQGNELLVIGDEVTFFLAQETFEKFSGRGNDANETELYRKAYREIRGVQVLFENPDIAILNKPSGVLSQQAKAGDFSLNEWLIGYLLTSGQLSVQTLSSFHPSVCNRLDRNTSGLVLCGKSLAGTQALSAMIKDHRIRKFYRAVAEGQIKQPLTLDGYLTKDTVHNKVTVTTSPVPTETAAPTKDRNSSGASRIYTICHPLASTARYTYLEVELITGKTHQIRAHLASIGHPLAGDSKYGNAANTKAVNSSAENDSFGQFLHAYRLEFPVIQGGVLSPLSGQVFTAPLPERFLAFLKEALEFEEPAEVRKRQKEKKEKE